MGKCKNMEKWFVLHNTAGILLQVPVIFIHGQIKSNLILSPLKQVPNMVVLIGIYNNYLDSDLVQDYVILVIYTPRLKSLLLSFV